MTKPDISESDSQRQLKFGLLSVAHLSFCFEESVPSIGTSYQISINLAKWFQRRFLEINHQKQELSSCSHE